MIKILSSIEEAERYKLPFLIFKPTIRKAYDISARIHDLRWPTVRYCVRIAGKEVRIKQFFLDWFFPGFPKSMLKDFSSGYSTIRSREVDDYILFLGKNYRKHDSASIWIHGTMIEMDSVSTVSDDEYEKLVMDLLSDAPNPDSLKKYQFPDRSHFVSGYETQWYEEMRISRLNWRRTGPYVMEIKGKKYVSSGFGYLYVQGKTHEIFIFQENEYFRSIWIEVTSEGIELEHSFYDVRKGNGLFDTEIKLADNLGTLVFRNPSGPGVIKIRQNSSVLTVGFSPGIKLDEISAFISGVNDIAKLLAEIRGSAPHLDANS